MLPSNCRHILCVSFGRDVTSPNYIRFSQENEEYPVSCKSPAGVPGRSTSLKFLRKPSRGQTTDFLSHLDLTVLELAYARTLQRRTSHIAAGWPKVAKYWAGARLLPTAIFPSHRNIPGLPGEQPDKFPDRIRVSDAADRSTAAHPKTLHRLCFELFSRRERSPGVPFPVPFVVMVFISCISGKVLGKDDTRPKRFRI